jgi:hypothetical protein
MEWRGVSNRVVLTFRWSKESERKTLAFLAGTASLHNIDTKALTLWGAMNEFLTGEPIEKLLVLPCAVYQELLPFSSR